jgi:GNAT superfamily N-acetyltransferase
MEMHRLVTGEGCRFRGIRLRALQDAGYAFASSYEEERNDPAERWEELAARSEVGEQDVVVIAVEDGDWLGTAGGYLQPGRSGVAGLWGMWVAPAARRRGIGSRLVDAVCDWAEDRGATILELSVTDRADGAEALYLGLGFTPTGERRPLERDPSITEILLARPL